MCFSYYSIISLKQLDVNIPSLLQTYFFCHNYNNNDLYKNNINFRENDFNLVSSKRKKYRLDIKRHYKNFRVTKSKTHPLVIDSS